VISNFVPPLEELKLAESAHTMDIPPRYILYVGDLSRDKGVHILIEAYRSLRDNGVKLVAMGRPADAVPEADDNITVLNGVPHAEAMWAMQHADIVVAPSVWPDPCPTVVLEAMTLGKPVITTRTGGMVDLIRHGDTGLLIEPGRKQELVDALTLLLHDEPLRRKLGTNATVAARAFSVTATVDAIERVYESVLSWRRRGPLRRRLSEEQEPPIPVGGDGSDP